MIVGVGIDIIEVKRLKPYINDLNYLEKYFSKKEIGNKDRYSEKAEYLAGRFAAKEAFLKALGKTIFEVSLKNVEVGNEPSGKPYINYNKLPEILPKGGIVHVSISHTRDLATAIVIIESA